VNRPRLLTATAAAIVLAATPAYAANNPKQAATHTLPCPHTPGKTARIWLEPGKRWTADNQCGAGTWLAIGWNEEGSDSGASLVLVAPKTHFGPRKSDPVPGAGGWINASLTTNPEFHGCQSGTTWVVWPNTHGVFDVTC
jgi:hypothetical protein